MPLKNKNILLILCGGIAAYKSLELIRRLREQEAHIRCVMTEAAKAFVTPLSVSALCGSKAHTDLFEDELKGSAGHIHLAHSADLVIVAPATADMMAKMANGLADNLASAILLAATCPVLIAPAMNPAMWENPATQRNYWRLMDDGIRSVGPNKGKMAENESGTGRMAEVAEILAAAQDILQGHSMPKPLSGKKVLVTAGPTYEAIDPVRFIGNRSSGKQGYAIAQAARTAGADVTLVSGPTYLPDPDGIKIIRVESARDMLAAVMQSLPVDIAIFSAAVADWHIEQQAAGKIKKDGKNPPSLKLVENPDILSTIAHLEQERPAIVVGFAAETDHVVTYAQEKLARKGCDVILANDVSSGNNVFGGDYNTIHLVTAEKVIDWPPMLKEDVAGELMRYLIENEL